MKYSLWLVLITTATLAQKPKLTVETIMQDPKNWVGTSPTSPFWSDDSKTLYFSWNPDKATGDSLYKVTFTGLPGKTPAPGKPTKVSPAERRALATPPTFAFNRARTQRLFERQDDLFLVDVKTNAIRQLTNTAEAESSPVFSGDERQAIFRRGSNLFSLDLAGGLLTQLTDFKPGKKKDDPKLSENERVLKADQTRLSTVLAERKAKKEEAERIEKSDKPPRPKEIYLDDRTLQNPQRSPNGQFITFRLAKNPTNAKTTIVPSYVTESGYTEPITSRTKVGSPQATSEFFVYDLRRDTVRALSVKTIPGIYDKPAYTTAVAPNPPKGNATAKSDTAKKARPVIINGPVWSDNGAFCVVVVRSQDNKDRWIMQLNLDSLTLKLLDRQHDDAWVGGPGIGSGNSTGNLGFLADDHTLWFQSEADGYTHLYTIDLLTGQRKQLTSGSFEVQQAYLSKDKNQFFLQTNEVHPGEQHFYRMAATGGPRTRLTTMTGANDVTLSPDETRLAIRYSGTNQPWELYYVPLTAGSKQAIPAVKLTDSPTDAFKKYPWREPTLVTIPARDKQPIYARLYKPDPTTRNGKSVVFVHGAGYLQNAHKWWSQYYREYMFHNLLADAGYTILDIDYRGSAGYGRDWRTGIYRFMGGKDLTDHVDAARWLVQTQAVDSSRIGIYGGSYGGFITLMAMFTTPGVFGAGAALRPVTDWAAYNHPYSANILNEPQTDSLAYRQSSPIYVAEGLRGHLLICHGLIDTNVHAQDALRLSQRLIELKKENWELALYPLEDHGFVEPTSWMDEYKRILKLFNERL